MQAQLDFHKYYQVSHFILVPARKRKTKAETTKEKVKVKRNKVIRIPMSTAVSSHNFTFIFS